MKFELEHGDSEVLKGVAEGRAFRSNDKGPAMSPGQFGRAIAMAVGDHALTRLLARIQGGPDILLTEAGFRAIKMVAALETGV